MSDIIVGIDLGTTNSEISVIKNGHPIVINGPDHDPILPSVVGIDLQGKILVGRAARNQLLIAPERTIKSVKRLMGQEVQVSLGEQQFRPEEISAMILRALKERAEKELGHPIQKAVITVPAYFNDTQRQATIEAGAIAGLDVVRILNEPTAAALVYDPDPTKSLKVLVYDLGGGTFDVSIVQTEKGVVEVLASHGDTHLGGDDFDELLKQEMIKRFELAHQVVVPADPVIQSKLLREAEEIKKKLSTQPFVKTQIEFLAEKDGIPLHLEQEWSRIEFEDLIEPTLLRTLESVDFALREAELLPREIDRIVLVGGSTKIPCIRTKLEEKLHRPCHQEIHPDLCVALGAGVQAGLISGQNVGTVLVDITPHSLGIRVIDDQNQLAPVDDVAFFRFAPVIQRGSVLPCSRSESYVTIHNNQTEVDIAIYQGESDDVRENHHLGQFRVEGLSKSPPGNVIIVHFDLDLNGTLKVSAREKSTGLSKQIVIDNKPNLLKPESQARAKDRIRELWDEEVIISDETVSEELFDELEREEPQESGMPLLLDVPSEGQREVVTARAILDRSERLKRRAAPEDQAEIETLEQKIRTHLIDRQWLELQESTDALSDILFYLEDA